MLWTNLGHPKHWWKSENRTISYYFDWYLLYVKVWILYQCNIHYNGQEKSLISDCNPHTRRRLRLSKSEKSFEGESNLGMPQLNWFFLNLYCSLVFGFILPTFGWKSPWKKSHDSKCKDFSASLLFQNGDGREAHLRRGNLGEPCRWNKFDHFFLKSNYQRPCLGDVQFIPSPGLEINDSNRANDLHISSWPTWWMPKVDSESRGIKAGVVSLMMPNSKLVKDCSFYQMTWCCLMCYFSQPSYLSFLFRPQLPPVFQRTKYQWKTPVPLQHLGRGSP